MNCLRGSLRCRVLRSRSKGWEKGSPSWSPVSCTSADLVLQQRLAVATLEVGRIKRAIPRCFRVPGRPRKDRAALARAFVAKAVYDMPTTRVLLDRLVT